jgi:hypothetical protein
MPLRYKKLLVDKFRLIYFKQGKKEISILHAMITICILSIGMNETQIHGYSNYYFGNKESLFSNICQFQAEIANCSE